MALDPINMKVGDTVLWRGSWGKDPAKEAVIESIERTREARSKYGKSVREIAWADKDYCVVNLTHGNWAYGEQLDPLPAE